MFLFLAALYHVHTGGSAVDNGYTAFITATLVKSFLCLFFDQFNTLKQYWLCRDMSCHCDRRVQFLYRYIPAGPLWATVYSVCLTHISSVLLRFWLLMCAAPWHWVIQKDLWKGCHVGLGKVRICCDAQGGMETVSVHTMQGSDKTNKRQHGPNSLTSWPNQVFWMWV